MPIEVQSELLKKVDESTPLLFRLKTLSEASAAGTLKGIDCTGMSKDQLLEMINKIPVIPV